jgi:hypothetical protein
MSVVRRDFQFLFNRYVFEGSVIKTDGRYAIIRDMNKEFPKSKIHRRIKELLHTRAKNFKRAGRNLS